MPDSDLSLDALLDVDDLCDEFESQLRQGSTPAIDEFAQRTPAQHRRKLLCELAKLEIGLLGESGKRVSSQDVLDRYLPLLPTKEDRQALRSTIAEAVAAAETAKHQPPEENAVTATYLQPTDDLADTDAPPAKKVTAPQQQDASLPQVDGFKISSVLGRGGMGVVYQAIQTALQRPVALKMILDSSGVEQAELDRFAREAQAVAELNDPRFVQIYEFGQSDGKPYMALEFVAGGSLEQHRKGEPQPPEFAAETVKNLASAMHQAHQKGLVHRDLKPHNVLLTDELQPKIADFGLVKRLDQDHTQTRQRTVMGTASYMAPEQSYGDPDVGPPADIHALGAILYCLLTGRPPFLAATVPDTILQVREQDPVPPSRLAPEVPKDLETICLKCLEKPPEKRYATAQALADDLENFQASRPITARPVGSIERAWRWARRNRTVAALGALCAAALIAVAVVSSVMSWRLSVANNELEEQTQAAKDARDTKSEQFNETMNVFNLALNKVDKELRIDLEHIDTRKAVMEIVIDGLEKVRDPTEKVDSVLLADRNEAIGLQRMGQIYQTANQLDDALRQFNKSLAILTALAEKKLDVIEHPLDLGAIYFERADVNFRLGNTVKARKDYDQAIKHRMRWTELAGGVPADDERSQDNAEWAVARGYYELGKLDLKLGEPEKALESFNRCRKWYLKIPEKRLREETELVRQLAALEQRLGEANYKTDRLKLADNRLRRALKKRLDLHRNHGGLLRDVRISRRALGDFFLTANDDPAEAWNAYQPVLSYFRENHKERPDLRYTKYDLAVIEYRIGALLLSAKKKGVALKRIPADDTAIAHFQRSCELREMLAEIDPDDMQAKLEWALALARSGKHLEAAEQGTILAEKAKGNPYMLFHSACIFALASETEDETKQVEWRNQAFALLDKLIQAGWKDRVSLRDDPDLEPLRSDPRLAELMKKLELQTTPRPPGAKVNGR